MEAEEPFVELVRSPEGDKWRVCGLGYCTEHAQRWQAEVMHQCLRTAKGLPASPGQ